MVEVGLDAAGRVTTVRIATGWDQEVEPALLGAAVLEAVQAAGVARLQAWGESVVETDGPPPTPAAPVPPDTAPVDRLKAALTAGGDSVPPDVLQALVATFREVNDSVRGLRAQLDATVAAQFVGRSPDGHVEAAVSGLGAPLAIRYDESWLARAHAANVAHQTLEALREAGRAAAGHDPAAIVADSPVGRLSRAMDDPEAFVASLRRNAADTTTAEPAGTSRAGTEEEQWT
ncbi:hypothetical protein [Cellulomonas composti]|uniref:hypothetical protein n=1 Tax=Cellulomonas composti TaxID=266130 RepID=UPI0011BEC7E3|nr:hypothetical protein [Cellulomonas composti]